MPYSAGVYTPASPEYPFVAGSLIVAADMNSVIADIAAALSIAWPRDGQAPPTANMPMGGFVFTGVGDAAQLTQFASLKQVQGQLANYIVAGGVTGTANAVALAISPSPAAYAAGLYFEYVVELENTSETVTHNVNSLGAVNTKKFYGGLKVPLAIGDLQVGAVARLLHDGTDFVLMNPRAYAQATDVASAATIDLDSCTGDLVDVTGTTTITAVTLRRGQERTVRFTGILVLTDGASLVLPGAANITTAAGDYAILRGYAAGVVRCVYYNRATAPPSGATFTSAEIALTSGTNADVAHGLGAVPGFLSASLRCKTAEANWSVDDEITYAGSPKLGGGGTAPGLTIAANATDIRYSISANDVTAFDRTTHNTFTLTPANWRLVLRART